MTKPARKNAAKPKPEAAKVAEPEAVEAPIEEAPAVVEAAPAEDVTADHDELAQPEAALPLIDGMDPEWAVSASVGSRYVQFTAHDGVAHAELTHMLGAKTVHIPGHAEAMHIASRTMTPPKLHPVRVTFTVRERIEA